MSLMKVLVWLTGIACCWAQETHPWISSEQQEQIVAKVRSALPAGWKITLTAMDRIPDGWYSPDRRGLEIDGKKGERVFKLWVVSEEWIGIRTAEASEKVYFSGEHKVIVHSDEEELRDPFWHKWGAGVVRDSLRKTRSDDVEGWAEALVNEVCQDRRCRDVATLSLLAIGVPARKLVFDCARHGQEKAQERCVSALDYLRGQDSVQLLDDLVSDPASSPGVRKSAASVLWGIGDASSGPALLKGLRMTDNREAQGWIVRAIADIHYQQAAPEILSLVQQGKGVYLAALASLHYQPAIPTIEQFCKMADFSSEWLLRAQEEEHPVHRWFMPTGVWPEVELLRLTGDWKPAEGNVRLLLLQPDRSERAVVLAENCGNRNLVGFLMTDGQVVVDANQYYEDKNPPSVWIGNFDLRVNNVAARIVDLSRWAADGRPHRIQWRLGELVSNQITMGSAR